MKDLALNWTLPVPALLGLAVAAVALLLVLIMAFKVHAFIALMTTSIATALAAGVPFAKLIDVLGFGFNPTLGNVMLLVALGAMLGRMLEVSGGAQTLADSMIRRFGEQRAGIGLAVASLLMGFPIFFDAGLVVMMPIIYAVARRVGGSFLSIALPSAISFSVMHVFVPPHPGPVSAAAIYGSDQGLVMLLGLVTAIVVWLVVGAVMATRMGKRFAVPVPDILEARDSAQDHEFASKPGVGKVLSLLLLPLVLILLNTGLNMVANLQPKPKAFLAEPWVAGLRVLGETPIALLITVFVSMFVLGWGAGKSGSLMEKVMDSALGPICSVVLITGAGGMFGGVLRATGIGDAVAKSLQGVGLPTILAAFLIALIVRVAQGSATVALTTAASLMAGVVAAEHLNAVQIAAIVIATAAGSVGFSHVNDSGFWLVSRFFGMNMKQTLATWTLLEGAIAVLGFAVSVVIYLLASLAG